MSPQQEHVAHLAQLARDIMNIESAGRKDTMTIPFPPPTQDVREAIDKTVDEWLDNYCAHLVGTRASELLKSTLYEQVKLLEAQE